MSVLEAARVAVVPPYMACQASLIKRVRSDLAEEVMQGRLTLLEALDLAGGRHVVHCQRDPYDVYIGRAMPRYGLAASKWANPFHITRDTAYNRERAVANYERRIRSSPDLMAALPELRGKVLGCWCAPKLCHGDVLVALAEESAA